MKFNVYFGVLLACCLLLAAAVVVLLLLLKRSKEKTNVNANEKFILSDEDKALIADIERGLETGEFKMYLQFVVDNRTKRLSSAEALSRWEREDGQVVLPGKYIPAMEKAGMMPKLDYYMFDKACQKLSDWKGSEFEDISISCNFTRGTVSESDFKTRIKSIVERYSFDRAKLIIEITEDSIEKNLDSAIENVLWVKGLGICIALDDIGSGYTSLVNLCEYPIDIVKLDRKLLIMANDERGKRLFLGIISLSHYLSLKVVCEGVETEEQDSLVFDSDCDFIQGWYYSKGLPEEKAEEFAREYMNKF